MCQALCQVLETRREIRCGPVQALDIDWLLFNFLCLSNVQPGWRRAVWENHLSAGCPEPAWNGRHSAPTPSLGTTYQLLCSSQYPSFYLFLS